MLMMAHLWSLLIRSQRPREDERREEGDRGKSAMFRTCSSSVPEAWWSSGLVLASCYHPAWHAVVPAHLRLLSH